MITRERLERTEYGRSLLRFINTRVLYRVLDWSGGGSQAGNTDSRERVGTLSDANVVSSKRIAPGANDGETRHSLVLDIDHPAWLIPSTTPGHYHLYIDVPGGLNESMYFAVLELLARAGVIEEGYANASKARGYSSARLPWIEKVQS
jgi:hypothetical protein